MRKVPSITSPLEEKRNYWEEWIRNYEEGCLEDEDDKISPSMYELIKKAIECCQYNNLETDSYEDVKKIVRVKIKLSRDLIHKMFNVETISVYGSGLYLPIEGLLLSQGTRYEMNYDECLAGKKGARLNFEGFPEEVLKTHDFRLAIPAYQGLFVPRKSELTEWLGGTWAIKFFEMNI